MSTSPFDHERDTALGDALRQTLTTDDDDAFVRRVVARLTEVEGLQRLGGEWWDVLGRWARPGVAAAALGMLLAAGLWLSGTSSSTSAAVILENPLQPAGEPFVTSALLTTSQPPTVDVVLGMALEISPER